LRTYFILLLFLAGSLLVTPLAAQTDASGYSVMKIGSKAPPFIGFTKAGTQFTLQRAPSHCTLLAFLDPGCEWCKSLLSELNSLKDSLGTSLRIIGITADTDSLRWNEFTSTQVPGFTFVVVSKNVLEEYKIQAAPTLYLLDKKLRIASSRLVRLPEVIDQWEKIK
jgi:hypothetical protein